MARRPSSTEKLAAVCVTLLAVLSPLYVDWKPAVDQKPDSGDDRGGGGLALWLPLLLIILVVAINLTHMLGQRYMRFDPYWIHRVGGSSGGIAAILLLLALVLRCKSSLRN